MKIFIMLLCLKRLLSKYNKSMKIKTYYIMSFNVENSLNGDLM